MAVERKTYTYNPFTYDKYKESQDVIDAKGNKTSAESALASYGDYKPSDAVTAAGTNKANAENALANYGDFSYSKSDTFSQIMDKILNREKFSYDVNGDALYQQYKDKYIQQGKMAMADTMGQAAAMTGGYGNSYAATVGNQAYQSSLQNLNDVIPELYQMAYDRYNQEGQDLYNQYGMLSDDRSTEYGMWGDKRNALVTDRDYYANDYNNAFTRDYGMWGDKRNALVADRDYYGNEYNNAFNRDYGMYSADRDLAHGEHTTSEGYRYQDIADANAFAQWQAEQAEQKRQYNETMKFNKQQTKYQASQAAKAAKAEDSKGAGAYTDTLWYATGTYDDNGNPVFRNSEGKTQAFGEGINPYTGSKNPDAKHGTFSNGYQPNNIGGTKLTKSGMSTNVTGKNQTIWQANGKYYLWRGDLNQYIEVDVSDLD